MNGNLVILLFSVSLSLFFFLIPYSIRIEIAHTFYTITSTQRQPQTEQKLEIKILNRKNHFRTYTNNADFFVWSRSHIDSWNVKTTLYMRMFEYNNTTSNNLWCDKVGMYVCVPRVQWVSSDIHSKSLSRRTISVAFDGIRYTHTLFFVYFFFWFRCECSDCWALTSIHSIINSKVKVCIRCSNS